MLTKPPKTKATSSSPRLSVTNNFLDKTKKEGSTAFLFLFAGNYPLSFKASMTMQKKGSVIKIRTGWLKMWQWSSEVCWIRWTKLNLMYQCPHCHSSNFVQNGFTCYRKQNYRCHHCKRQFVGRDLKQGQVKESNPAMLSKLLLERMSLRGIARVLERSLNWVYRYVVKLWLNQKGPVM